MFLYSPKSFFISLLWIGGGLSIYYGYAKHRERAEVGPKILIEEKEIAHKDFRLVLGIEEKAEVHPLMKVALSLVKEKDGEIFATHVISLPPQTPLNVGKRFIEERRKLLKIADELGEKNKIPVSFNIRVSHKIYHGLLDSVSENDGNVLILAAGKITPRGKILGSVLDPLVQEAPCDIGVMKIKGEGKIRKILLPTAGGPNAKLAFEWGLSIAKQNRGKLTLLSVISDEKMSKRAENCLLETKKSVQYDPNIVEEKIVSGRSILKTILVAGKNYDLILIGASKEGLWKRVRFGTIPEKLTRTSPVSILVVKKYEGGIFSWIRRFLAG